MGMRSRKLHLGVGSNKHTVILSVMEKGESVGASEIHKRLEEKLDRKINELALSQYLSNTMQGPYIEFVGRDRLRKLYRRIV